MEEKEVDFQAWLITMFIFSSVESFSKRIENITSQNTYPKRTKSRISRLNANEVEF